MKRFTTAAMAAVILLLNLWLNGPLFMKGELPFRGSIEGGYVGMARFVAAHPDPWGWNPLPYCGLPTQFLYVPLLPYATALGIRLLPQLPPDWIYRTLVSLAACLGPVTLFFFGLYFTGSRRWSFAAAVAYSFLSPSYALFPAVEKDRGIVQLPWRIQVLAKYGEGPHNVGLTLLPLTLLAVWRAATERGYARIVAAAVMLALTPLTNWVAALALAIAAVLLLIAGFGEPGFHAGRVLAAAGLAWLLACFWLTFSFVKTIAFNWPVDSFAYRLQTRQWELLAGAAAAVIAVRGAFWWRRGSFYFCFVTLAALVFGWIATMFYVCGVDTIPESRRYAIEFELFAALAVIEGLRLAMRSPNSTVRLCAVGTAGVMLLVGAPQLWAYATQGWRWWKPIAPETTLEYGMARWVAGRTPEGRVFASGGLRFRLNSWFDLPQVGGGFETGLRNRVPVDLAYRIRVGMDADETVRDLKALGVQYLAIHGPKSREYYRDFLRPERVTTRLPAVFRMEDDAIYALPPRPLAHLMKADELPGADVRSRPEALTRYVAAIEDPARPNLRVDWSGAAQLTISGAVRPEDLVDVQVNADPGWQAAQDGREIEITQDRLGFVVLHPGAAADTRIQMRYRGTVEQKVMAAVSALTWVAALGALPWSRPRKKRGLPEVSETTALK